MHQQRQPVQRHIAPIGAARALALQAFVHKASGLQAAQAGRVLGLDIGLHAVQRQPRKGQRQKLRQRQAHPALAPGLARQPKAQLGAVAIPVAVVHANAANQLLRAIGRRHAQRLPPAFALSRQVGVPVELLAGDVLAIAAGRGQAVELAHTRIGKGLRNLRQVVPREVAQHQRGCGGECGSSSAVHGCSMGHALAKLRR